MAPRGKKKQKTFVSTPLPTKRHNRAGADLM
jgi:hypothetical protein